jgi:hypothetical protein
LWAEEFVIRVKRENGRLLIGGQLHTSDEARELVDHQIWAAMPAEFGDDGVPLCPKCGIEATEDTPGFWVCAVIECDGYHQTVHEHE